MVLLMPGRGKGGKSAVISKIRQAKGPAILPKYHAFGKKEGKNPNKDSGGKKKPR